MDFKRWILPAVVATVSFIISILSLRVLREFGFVFSDKLLLEFVLITSVLSTVSTYCVKKLLERCIHSKHPPHDHICQQRPACPRKQVETSVFLNLPVGLSDIGVEFRRRHSYPLQLSEKLYYAFTNRGKTFSANSLSHGERIVSEPDSMKERKQTKDASLKSKSSDNALVILRECIREIDDIFEQLKSLTESDILHQNVQSDDNSGHFSGVKHAKTKNEETQISRRKTASCSTTNKQQQEFSCLAPTSDSNLVPNTLDPVVERSPCDSLDLPKDKGLQRVSDVGYLSHGEDNEAADDSLSHSPKEASFSTNFDSCEHEEQLEHSQSDSLSLCEDNTACGASHHSKVVVLSATAHLPEVSENMQPQSGNNFLSHSSVERKRTVVISKHSSMGISSGIILDPVKLGQELKELGICYSLDYEADASGYEPDETFPNILDFPTREIELKDFVSSQVTGNYSSSTYLACSPDNISDSANTTVRGSISNPLELGKELTGSATHEDIEKLAMDSTSSSLSSEPADSASYSQERGNIALSGKHKLESEEKSKQEAKESILSRFRNSLKFKIDAKDRPKKDEPRY